MAFGDRVMLEKGTWMETAQARFEELGHKRTIVRNAPVKGGAVGRDGDRWVTARDPRIESALILP